MKPAKYGMISVMVGVVDNFQIDAESQNGGNPKSNKDGWFFFSLKPKDFGEEKRQHRCSHQQYIRNREFFEHIWYLYLIYKDMPHCNERDIYDEPDDKHFVYDLCKNVKQSMNWYLLVHFLFGNGRDMRVGISSSAIHFLALFLALRMCKFHVKRSFVVKWAIFGEGDLSSKPQRLAIAVFLSSSWDRWISLRCPRHRRRTKMNPSKKGLG